MVRHTSQNEQFVNRGPALSDVDIKNNAVLSVADTDNTEQGSLLVAVALRHKTIGTSSDVPNIDITRNISVSFEYRYTLYSIDILFINNTTFNVSRNYGLFDCRIFPANVKYHATNH